METQISELLSARSELEKHLSQTQHLQQVTINERAEWIAEHRALATKLDQQVQRKNRLQTEIEEAERQYEQEQQHLADARGLLSTALDQMETDAFERDRLQAEREILSDQLNGLREESREAAGAVMRSELRSQNLNTQVATLREGIQRMEAQLRDLETRETELFDTLPTADNPDAENKEHLTALLDQRVAAEADLTRSARVGDTNLSCDNWSRRESSKNKRCRVCRQI